MHCISIFTQPYASFFESLYHLTGQVALLERILDHQLKFPGHCIRMTSPPTALSSILHESKNESFLRPSRAKEDISQSNFVSYSTCQGNARNQWNKKVGGKQISMEHTFGHPLEYKASGPIFSVRMMMMMKT